MLEESLHVWVAEMARINQGMLAALAMFGS